MKKILILITGGMLGLSPVFSQNEIDALRYSQHQYGGTARFRSMAGAFGALGGDFSVLSLNPAGIGIYRKSEFTFTPSFFSQKTTSDFNGSNNYASQYLNAPYYQYNYLPTGQTGNYPYQTSTYYGGLRMYPYQTQNLYQQYPYSAYYPYAY